MVYLNFQEWLSSLSAEKREAVTQLIGHFKSAGTPNPEAWARSEASEDIPQLARFLFLKSLWPRMIDRWCDSNDWIASSIDSALERPQFADAGEALARLRKRGVSDKDIGLIARKVAYETVFSMLYRLDIGFDEDGLPALPGWRLVEIDADGKATGRDLSSLHESLLTLDPSGRDGAPA